MTNTSSLAPSSPTALGAEKRWGRRERQGPDQPGMDRIFEQGDASDIAQALACGGNIYKGHLVSVIDRNDASLMDVLIDRCESQAFELASLVSGSWSDTIDA